MKIFRILSVVALGAALMACQNLVEFEHHSFVSYTPTDNNFNPSINEDYGTYTIPVSVYNTDGAVSVTVTPVDGSAKAGTNYSLVEPANGVLSFSAGETTKNVVVSITNLEGEFTGSLDFAIDIKSATEGVETGASSRISFTVKDLDHPLSAFLGTWTLAGVADYWGDVYDFAFTIVAPDASDVTYVEVHDLEPYFASYGYTAARGYNILRGYANDAKTTIECDETGTAFGYSTTYWVSFNDATVAAASDYAPFTFNLNDDGTLTMPYAWGVRVASGWYCLYEGPLTFTKQ